ncbi:MAG: potassium channel protein [Candidatus Riflebacteria bacterium]|nr:potassium channel protein [Candidatus Riflebacteria bacterium]
MQKRPLLTALFLFVLLLGIGTFGYRFIEGSEWTNLDGLYMTVITLATVGYGEVHPLSSNGRIFTICLLLLGGGLMAYTVSSLAQFILEGKLRELWGKRRMKDRIKGMKNHYILCGAGNTGLAVASELVRKNIPFVVIDNNAKVVEELIEEDVPTIEGDATLDEILLESGLERASGLVSSLPHDADNVFVSLTAKGINPHIFIVSTASKIESVSKLKRAGANYVVSPNIIAGTRMASVLVRPSVVDFLDATMAGEDHGLQMEEIRIYRESYLDTKALKDADIRRRSGAIIVSVKKAERSIINPEPTYVFESGDILIVLGDRDQIGKMCELASGKT